MEAVVLGEDCGALRARADMLHKEARHGREKAVALGVEWEGYAEQIRIADRVEALAQEVETRIIKHC
jgi:hypothetical protein